jgi:high-affinity iron transporter
VLGEGATRGIEMAAGFLLALREGLEAAIIVGLLLGALRRTRHQEMSRFVWVGVGLAIVLSAGIGFGLVAVGAGLEGRAEELFEGTMLTLAAAILTWVVVWMQGQYVAAHAEQEMRRAASAGQRWAVFLAAFVAVGREGLETGLFVSAAALAGDRILVVLGAILGLITAALLGAGMYATTLRLNLRRFFTVTSALIVLVAAGMLGHAVHEFSELGLIPPLIEPVWDISRGLRPDSPIGQLAAVLLGYDPTPSLAQAVTYVGYLVGMAIMFFTRNRRPALTVGSLPAA